MFLGAATGFFVILDLWAVDIENKIVTYPSQKLKQVRTFHFDDFKVLYSQVNLRINSCFFFKPISVMINFTTYNGQASDEAALIL